MSVLRPPTSTRTPCGAALVAALAASLMPAPGGAAVTDEQFVQLMQENRALRSMLESQQAQIDELRRRLDGSQPASLPPPPAAEAEAPAPAPRSVAVDASPLRFSGEFSVVWLEGGSDGDSPNGEFRVDDAFLRLDAQITDGVYLFSELELSKHTTYDNTFHLGETYIEFEGLIGTRRFERLLNLRAGRVDIPFGEEYLRRDPLTNPLVTNSLSDIWGIDEGFLLFGEAGRASYAFAVQNGSSEFLADFDPDKAITLRLGYNPTSRLHLSASAMRTGDLNAAREPLSEVWIGNAVFRPIGSTATTTYAAELAELDLAYSFRGGRVAGAIGTGRYSDDDPAADNTTDFRYYQVEAQLDLDRRWWVATRFSTLHADPGYPMPGLGSFGRYFFGPTRTEDLWRLGLGAGYRISDNALVKLEYTLERGTAVDGSELTDRDQLAAQIGVGF